MELGMAPYRGGEAPWGAVGALWHMLRVTRVPECRVRLLVGARPKCLALPSWAGLSWDGPREMFGGLGHTRRLAGNCGLCVVVVVVS